MHITRVLHRNNKKISVYNIWYKFQNINKFIHKRSLKHVSDLKLFSELVISNSLDFCVIRKSYYFVVKLWLVCLRALGCKGSLASNVVKCLAFEKFWPHQREKIRHFDDAGEMLTSRLTAGAQAGRYGLPEGKSRLSLITKIPFPVAGLIDRTWNFS